MFIFPAHILTPSSIRRAIDVQSLSGGRALSGTEDTILADGGGRWVVEYSDIPLETADKVRVWEAWLDYIGGGLTEILVPLLSFATSPRSYVGGRPKAPSNLFYDEYEWPTELRYSSPEHEAVISVAADLRATKINLRVDKGPEPKGGEIFMVGDRAYRVIRRSSPTGPYVIAPPLREALAIETPAIFDFPLVRARLEPGQDFSASLFRAKTASVSIRFWESV